MAGGVETGERGERGDGVSTAAKASCIETRRNRATPCWTRPGRQRSVISHLAERESDLRASLQAAIYSTEDAEGKSRAEGVDRGRKRPPSGGFQKQHMVGSILYMSPEVLMRRERRRGGRVRVRGDPVRDRHGHGAVQRSSEKRRPTHTVLDASYNEQDLAKAIGSERAFASSVTRRDVGISRGERPRGIKRSSLARGRMRSRRDRRLRRFLVDSKTHAETYAHRAVCGDGAAVRLPPATDRAEAATAAECALKEPIDWRTQEPAFATPSEEARESAAAFSAGL